MNVTFSLQKKKKNGNLVLFFLNIASITKCDTALITKSENQLCSTKNTASTRKLKHAILYRSYKKKKKRVREREKISKLSPLSLFPYTVPFMNKKNAD